MEKAKCEIEDINSEDRYEFSLISLSFESPYRKNERRTLFSSNSERFAWKLASDEKH